MNYLKIEKASTANGIGFRVVLWVSGCEHKCFNCQNPQTWQINSGVPFDDKAKQEIFSLLEKDFISGITYSGGDPLHKDNLESIEALSTEIKNKFPAKTQWLYTGYSWEYLLQDLKRFDILQNIDILVDGQYIDELRDVTLAWRGSSNQRVIDVKETLKQHKIVLYE